MSEVGFTTMGQAESGADVQTIGVGMLGYAFSCSRTRSAGRPDNRDIRRRHAHDR
jgi:hypothetical protein